MHTVWKGSIQFGLVHIPIKLHSATDDKDIKLRQLHKKCYTPISYQKTCTHCDESVEPKEMIKAYEVVKDEFVPIESADLEQLKKDNETKAVQIIDFVELKEVDPIYFNRAYFIAPVEGGSKAYVLLQQALAESKKIGIAKIIIRSKEHLAIVRTYHNALIMETIHFPDEIRQVENVPNLPEETTVDNKELKTALMLIDQLTTSFDPSQYKDEYRDQLMDLIEQKRKGEQIVTTRTKEKTEAKTTDLMSALEASLERTKPKRKKAVAKQKTTKATTKKNA